MRARVPAVVHPDKATAVRTRAPLHESHLLPTGFSISPPLWLVHARGDDASTWLDPDVGEVAHAKYLPILRHGRHVSPVHSAKIGPRKHRKCLDRPDT